MPSGFRGPSSTSIQYWYENNTLPLSHVLFAGKKFINIHLKISRSVLPRKLHKPGHSNRILKTHTTLVSFFECITVCQIVLWRTVLHSVKKFQIFHFKHLNKLFKYWCLPVVIELSLPENSDMSRNNYNIPRHNNIIKLPPNQINRNLESFTLASFILFEVVKKISLEKCYLADFEFFWICAKIFKVPSSRAFFLA